MSRSGYCDDMEDQWAMIRWRGAVKSAIRGKRGQSLLRELIAALDAMPKKALCVGELVTTEGEVCTLGAVGLARGIDMRGVDPEEPEHVAAAFGIARALAQEIVWENDENAWRYRDQRLETPEERWQRMRDWAVKNLAPQASVRTRRGV